MNHYHVPAVFNQMENPLEERALAIEAMDASRIRRIREDFKSPSSHLVKIKGRPRVTRLTAKLSAAAFSRPRERLVRQFLYHSPFLKTPIR